MISILQYILYAYASVISSRDMVCIDICSDCRLGESHAYANMYVQPSPLAPKHRFGDH